MIWFAIVIAAVIAVAMVGVKQSAAGLAYRLMQVAGAIVGVILLGWFMAYVLPFIFAAALWLVLVGGAVVVFIWLFRPSTK